MKVKTSELTDLALDWAVTKASRALGKAPTRCFDCRYFIERATRDGADYLCSLGDLSWCDGCPSDDPFGDGISADYGVHQKCPLEHGTAVEEYSSDWSLAGPIIERENISIERPIKMRGCAVIGFYDWRADHPKNYGGLIRYHGEGPTALIAAMRCYVESKLGKDVDIPDEFVKENK